MVCSVFFFQAEDGIRDAQESRGLGDVYKRQIGDPVKKTGSGIPDRHDQLAVHEDVSVTESDARPVSYTHLTLPTIYSV